MIAQMVARGQLPAPQQPLLFQTQSQRESQVEMQSASRGNSGMYQQPAGGYYAPHSAGALPPQMQQMQQPMMPPQGPAQAMRAPSPALAVATSAPRSRSLTPSHSPSGIGPELQQVGSEGATSTSGNGNGHGPGWHTPASELSDAERAAVDEGATIRRPTPPQRAPGHTYSTSSTPSSNAL